MQRKTWAAMHPCRHLIIIDDGRVLWNSNSMGNLWNNFVCIIAATSHSQWMDGKHCQEMEGRERERERVWQWIMTLTALLLNSDRMTACTLVLPVNSYIFTLVDISITQAISSSRSLFLLAHVANLSYCYTFLFFYLKVFCRLRIHLWEILCTFVLFNVSLNLIF